LAEIGQITLPDGTKGKQLDGRQKNENAAIHLAVNVASTKKWQPMLAEFPDLKWPSKYGLVIG
jgi:hypothetical protein